MIGSIGSTHWRPLQVTVWSGSHFIARRNFKYTLLFEKYTSAMGFFDNCQPNRRFNAYNSESFPGGPTTWHTIDWDQRRYISTSVPEEVDMSDGGEEIEERVIQTLAQLVDQLDTNVNLVNLSIEGDFISTSSDTRHDSAMTPLYCPLDMIPEKHRITDYEEVPGHGSVEVVVGFTSIFVPGMTIQDNPSRIFKFKYLEQLIEVVDNLNLNFGIIHQDLAPRNLLINPITDTLQLFDFSCAGRLGWDGATEDQGLFSNSGSFKLDLIGVIATIYEVITQDTQLAEQVLMGADISTIQEKEWVKHPDVRLDRDVTYYRQRLERWLQWRNQPGNLISHYTQAPSYIEWPQSWRPEIPLLDQEGNAIGEAMPTSSMPRSALRALGLNFIEWERPAHNKIPHGFCVLGNGRLVAQTNSD
ncbi:hypothetical protein LA080_003087 [Diaporthe eres]|nr:hypothetical protein LA080_003087 [Diaporthe eres]